MWRDVYSRLVGRFSGEAALRQAAQQNHLERYFTFPNFALSAERCGEELRAAGLCDVLIESFPADGATTWFGWKSMKAWDVTAARLWLTAPYRTLLCDWSVLPESLVMYSGSCDKEAEVIEWDGQDDSDLTGKIPFTHHRINDVFAQLRRKGIRGILSDFVGTLPGVRDPSDLPDDVRWENSALRSGAGQYWGFMITPRQGALISSLLRQGPVRVQAQIATRSYDGVFHSVTAVIPGSEELHQEILFVSHLYEPGANDNASGAGVGLELARSLNAAITQGVLPRPRRTIRFLFNWEGYGLCAWLHKHRDRIPDLLGGLNVDEVGVDQQQGASVLHLFMPPAANPSCTGPLLAHLCSKILPPSIRWKAVADRAEVINDTISSDPNLDIPLPCLIQYPSRNYHSSADRLPTLSAKMMEWVGLVSATHLYFLAACHGEAARWLAELVARANRQRWELTQRRLADGTWPFDEARTECWLIEQAELSLASVERFGLPAGQLHVLQDEQRQAISDWCRQWQSRFPQTAAGQRSLDVSRTAARLVLERTTLASPKAWALPTDGPDDERSYRKLLYHNRLDLLFHRILYWTDGRRSLLDIIERLEFEQDELLQDSSIARTSSGLAIESTTSPPLDRGVLLALVDRIVRSGYLCVHGTHR